MATPPTEDMDSETGEGELAVDDGSTVLDAAEVEDPGLPEDANALETFNLVPIYAKTEKGKAFLAEASERVLEDFEAAWQSTRGYRDWRTVIQKLFVDDAEKKDYPHEDAASVHLAFMAQAVARLHARMVTTIFPRDGAFFHAIPTTIASKERVANLDLHMTWELRTQMPDFIPQQDKALMEDLLTGSVVIHSYRDFQANRNRHDYLTCEDFFIPYATRSSDPSLADVPYKGRRLRKYKHELLQDVRLGHYDAAAVQKILGEEDVPGTAVDETPVQEQADQSAGVERPTDGAADPFIFIEYHGWMELMGSEELRAVCVTVERDSGEVVQFFVREEEDWRDKQRFEQESAAFERYQQALGAHQDALDNRQVATSLMASADPEAQQQAAQIMSQPPPQAPMEVPEPAPVKLVPIEFFTHIYCDPNPFGVFGIGVGRRLAGFNMAGDTIMEQFVDQATLANDPPAIIPKTSGVEGDVALGPGAVIMSDLPVEQVDKTVIWKQIPPANPQMVETVMMLGKAAEGLASAPDVYGGEPGKSNETWRGITTRVQEANKQLTAYAQRYVTGLTQVLRKHARLNSKFLPDSQTVSTTDEQKKPVTFTVTRADYLEDFDIAFTADPRMASDAQIVGEADDLLQLTMSTAQAHQSKELVMLALMESYTARKRPNMVQAIQQMMKSQGPPPARDHVEEDADFLRGKPSPVNPADDHQKHADGHKAMLSSPMGALLPPEMKKALEQHIREHVAAIMLQMHKEGLINAPGEASGQGGPEGMAGGPGDPGPAHLLGGTVPRA